jgi:2-polyprenyl-3-methyl-5-hydroxy-6-metoxy-1,4-benzoquinol methylase
VNNPPVLQEDANRQVDHAFRFSLPEGQLRARQQPLVDRFFAGRRAVLDIGCGRGIVLDLLKELGVEAEGVDIMPEAASYCQAKGHRVHLAEANQFLATKTAEYGGIFCSHVIEHLDVPDAERLVAQAFTALQPGGLLLIVTPNPRDIAIIAEVFWLDPSHRRPYPGELVASMLAEAGFTRITVETPRGRPSGRRDWPVWLFRKLIFGRFFGNPETIAAGYKPGG